jgi:hypothetical protein
MIQRKLCDGVFRPSNSRTKFIIFIWAIAMIAIQLFIYGCKQYTGGLENSIIYKEIRDLKWNLFPGSPAAIRGDTLLLIGYTEDWFEDDTGIYTVMRLAEPSYYEGYYSVSSYTNPVTNTTSVVTTKKKASVNLIKSDTYFALRHQLPKCKAPYIFSARLSENTIAHKESKIVVVELVRYVPELWTRLRLGNYYKDLIKKRESLALQLTPHETTESLKEDEAKSTLQTDEIKSIRFPILPLHIYDLSAKIFLLCKRSKELEDYQSPVPVDLSVEVDWSKTASIYEKIAKGKHHIPELMTIEDAGQVLKWARASELVEDSQKYLLGEKNIFYLGIDREQILQYRRDKIAASKIRKATKQDHLWYEPYYLLYDVYKAVDQPDLAKEILEKGMKQAGLDSALVDEYAEKTSDKSTCLSGTFRYKRLIKPEPVRQGRNWRLGATFEIKPANIEFAFGVNALYNISKDLSFEVIWLPLLVGENLSEDLQVTVKNSALWRSDRLAFNTRYQLPIRLQTWKYGFRLHSMIGIEHYYRQETFDYYSLDHIEEVDLRAEGWIAKVALGFTERAFFTKNNKRFSRFEIGYQFSTSTDVEAELGGKPAVLTYGPDNQRLTYDPAGFFISYSYLF